MKGDHELEAALRRYRPADPRSELRGRVVTPPLGAPRTWPWAVAAAVLLTVALTASSAAARVRTEQHGSAPSQEAGWIDPETQAVLREVYGDRLSALLTSAAAVAPASHPEPEPSEADSWR